MKGGLYNWCAMVRDSDKERDIKRIHILELHSLK
jgi:hypothetical protein